MFRRIFVCILAIFYVLNIAAIDMNEISVNQNTQEYFIGDHKIVVYDIDLYNCSNSILFLWFNKEKIINYKPEDLIRYHFFNIGTNNDVSLYQMGMDTDISIVHDVFTTFTKILDPKSHFRIQILCQGRGCRVKFDALKFIRNHVVVYSKLTLEGVVKGLDVFTPMIYFQNDSIIIPFNEIKRFH